jgi:benzoyl-CoA reductase/2-hydroxyglutaryl-CoA dehydratase subunit BcrC/BadD/HgdB
MELSATSEINDFTAGLKSLNSRLKDNGNGNKKGPRVMIIGNFITEEKLWQMFSGLDMDLVCDDLCISNRYYEMDVKTRGASGAKDLLDQVAQRYMDKPACMRMADTGKKLKDLKKRIAGKGVQGVIFISLKFCDTMLYSFPLIRKELAAVKIPVLYLEIEYNNFSEGQVKTRMQAFLEMI